MKHLAEHINPRLIPDEYNTLEELAEGISVKSLHRWTFKIRKPQPFKVIVGVRVDELENVLNTKDKDYEVIQLDTEKDNYKYTVILKLRNQPLYKVAN